MIGLGIIILLIAVNGIFVAMEFVIVGSRLSRLEALSSGGKTIAERLEGAEAQDRYVAVAQLGITLASIGLGMYGEHQIAIWLEEPMAALGIDGAAVHLAALILAVVILTYFHVVFGEMIPKALALKGADRLLIAMWPLIRFFELVFRPFVWALNVISQSLLSLFGLNRSEARYYTPRELAAIAEDSGEGGSIAREQAEFIQNIVRLQGRRAEELMTPRRHVITLDLDHKTEADYAATILNAGPSRIPVTRGGLDSAIGVVHVKDVIRHKTEEQTPLDAGALIRMLHPLPKTLASVDTATLLDNMRKHGTHMALVADEHGSVLGAVAFEDAIEEVVGEVHSGFEIDVPDTEDHGGRRWKIPGTTPLSRLREQYGWTLETQASSTIAGLLLEHLRKVPEQGDVVETDGLRFEVEAVEGLSISRVRAEKLETGGDAANLDA
ncbi:hemolysin, putative [Fulvimarina pelagi HTCC2506]|uniref:Hemolysin, putative n=1 Tax=Fulvimarina pelagi HTCC2506 TaxID=314231 RepID=Q0G5G1_9HYPH|nr:hemolysin family protein [Fulvimarina pelagi]EAU43103.1 hemolysin, putative [Fulvimarina pelagi HTCC2506]